MASKVNVKFVVILAGALLVVGAGAAGLAVLTLKKGPAQNVALAKELEAKNDFEGAQRAWSRAVNKDPNNATYLRSWLAAISKTKPETQPAYKERLEQFYMIRRKISEVESGDIKTQRDYLDDRLTELRRFGADATTWGAFASDVDKIAERFPDGSPEREQLRRYRGLARLAQMNQNFEMSDAEKAAAKDDLEAALKVNPDDQMAAAGIGDWNRLSARATYMIKDMVRTEQILTDSLAALNKFVADHPPAPYGISGAIETEIMLTSLKPPPNTTVAQLYTSMQPKAQKWLDALKTEKTSALDEGIVTRAVQFAMQTGITDAPEQGAAILDRMLADKPNFAWYMLAKANISLIAGKYDQAISRLQELIDLPDLTVSPEGWALMKVRDGAAAQQVSTALGKWEVARTRESAAKDDESRTKAAKERADALKQADELYEKTKNRPNIEERPRKYMKGFLAYAHDDLIEARRELNDYVQLTQRTDVRAMMLLADVMRRQNTIGEAKVLYDRVLELDRNNYGAMLALADIEFRLNNYRRVKDLYESAIRLDPNNEGLKKNIEVIKNLIEKGGSDPILVAINTAQELMNRTPQDAPGATKALTDAEASARTERDFAMLATALARIGAREEAARMVDRALVKHATDATLLDLKRGLASTDPLKDVLELIDKDNSITPEIKVVRKHMACRQYGRPDLAENYLDELTKLSPENPLVIGAQFDRALSKKDLAAAAVIVELAKKNNTDRLGGRIFEMQLLAAQGKLKEAAATAQQATEIDQLNPAAWRMLGQLQLQNGLIQPALGSFERALQISPTDSGSMALYTQALVNAGRAKDALAFCREKSQLGTNDAMFINQWLTLEFEIGDKDRAMERRTRIFSANPSNTQNAIELARNAVMTRNAKLATEVVNKLKTMSLAQEEQVPLAALEAAVLSLNGDRAGAMAAFDKLVATVAENMRDGRVHAGFARLIMDLGDVALAEEILIKGQAVEPKDLLPSSRELADMYFRIGKFDKALPVYKTIYETQPDPRGILARRYAETLLKARKFAEADALLTKVAADAKAKGTPLDQPLLLLMVESVLGIASESSDAAAFGAARAKAAKLLDDAIAADPEAPIGYYRRAQFRSNDATGVDGTIEDLERVLKSDPRYPGARVPLAMAYIRKQSLDRGISILRDGLTNEPKNVDYRVTLVRVLVANGRLRDALTELAAGKKDQPDELSWYNISGEIYMLQQNFTRAADEFKVVWEKNKTPVNAKNYVETLVRKSPPDLDTAGKVLAEPAIKTDTNPMLLVMRAMVKRLDKRPDDSKADLRAALRNMNTTDINQCNDLLVLCAQVLFPTVDDAVATFKEIAPPEGHSEALRLQLAARGAQSTTASTAAASVDELVRLSASENKAVAGNASRLAGESMYRSKKYAEAERMWRRSLELLPDNAEAMNNLAYLLSKHLNRAKDALPLAERAAQLMPDRVNVIDTLGQVYMDLGDLSKADEILTAAVAGSNNPIEKAAPLIHLIQLKLAKKDRAAADGLYRELQNLLQTYPEIKTRYADELEQLKKQMEGQN